jgi:hypothetical protein
VKTKRRPRKEPPFLRRKFSTDTLPRANRQTAQRQRAPQKNPLLRRQLQRLGGLRRIGRRVNKNQGGIIQSRRMKPCLLDTDILAEFLRDHPRVVAKVGEIPPLPCGCQRQARGDEIRPSFTVSGYGGNCFLPLL